MSRRRSSRKTRPVQRSETECEKAQACGLDRYTVRVRYDEGVKMLSPPARLDLLQTGFISMIGHGTTPNRFGHYRVQVDVARDRHGQKNRVPITTLLHMLFDQHPGVHVVSIEADKAFGEYEIIY